MLDERLAATVDPGSAVVIDRNADNSIGGALTMRRGLENSVNVVTAHLLDGGISVDPEKSLDEVCGVEPAALPRVDMLGVAEA
jgi:hypothetical protein